ncbi:MAG: NAD-dependent DNA ligase LigA [Saprospiraceae bacterium]
MVKYPKATQRELFEQSKQFLKAGSVLVADLEVLRKVIVYHEWRYSVLNEPMISDFEYDQLYQMLKGLEAKNPLLVTVDSPTQRVSSDLGSDFPPVAHLTPMLSLDNSYNAEDLNDFDQRIKKLVLMDTEEAIEYCVEPKFDGGSIALVYEKDFLTRGATRGNGVEGEEMTRNAKAMRSIPMKANFSAYDIEKVELRGEALIRKDIFEKLNKDRMEAGQSVFANPRNAATGVLRVKDPREVQTRGIEAFIYQLGYGVNAAGENRLGQFETHDEGIKFLEKLGFKVPVEERKLCKNIQEVIDFCLYWQEQRENYPYEIDGMVVKVNRLDLQERCGYTSHHPRWAIAFKFKAKQATTKLVNIEYQVGKIGSITPVAKLDPVQLAGVTVSSVSLHNEEFIRSKDIRIGDTVLVERAGDVIPYIVKTMEELRDGSEEVLVFPEHCPSCQTKLVKPEKEAAWRCTNTHCEAQVLQRMSHHVSKDAMNIDGFGQAYVERFFELGWVKNLADIYRLDYDKLATLEGFGAKSAANLKKAVDKAKQNPLHRFLYGLSIHHLGKKVSKLLAAEVSHVMELKDWSEEDFTIIKDVGPVVAENVMAFFADEKQIELLKEMESLGVNVKQTEADRPKTIAADAPLIGKTILFTGSLQQMSRKEAQTKAESAGAKNISAVSSNLNILVAGEKAGSKLKKALALGTVQVLSEEEFLALIQ